MAKKIPKSLEEYYGKILQQNPEVLISQLRVELEVLRKKIEDEQTKAIYLVGRKARHLFHPIVTSRLIEMGFSINFLNVMKGKSRGKQIYYITSSDDFPKEVILLADSIDEGKEKTETISLLGARDIVVSKLFCYVANKKGINNIVAETNFDQKNIVSVHTVEHEEYESFYKRLQAYYQSRFEPMEIEHVYAVAKFAKRSTRSDLFKIFKNAITKSFKCDSGRFSKGKLFAPANIVNYNFECLEYNQCKKRAKSKIERAIKIEFEYLQVRTKARLERTNTTVCLIVFCPLLFQSLDSLIKEGKCRRLVKECELEKAVYDPKDVSKEELAAFVCPECLENYVSSPILAKIEKNFKL